MHGSMNIKNTYYSITFPDTYIVSSHNGTGAVIDEDTHSCVEMHVQLAAQSTCLPPFLLDENMVVFF